MKYVFSRIFLLIPVLLTTACEDSNSINGYNWSLANVVELQSGTANRPDIDSSLCHENLELKSSQLKISKSPLAFITKVAGEGVAKPVEMVPGEIEWWLRGRPSVGLEELSTALHETSHRANYLATVCNAGRRAFVVDGKVVLIDGLLNMETPYFLVDSILGKSQVSNSFRYKNYIINKKNKSNDLFVMLDELASYIVAGQLEIAIAESGLLKPNGGLYDGNIAGAVDFKLFTLAYITLVCELDNIQCKRFDEAPLRALIGKLMNDVSTLVARRNALTADLRRNFSISQAALSMETSKKYSSVEDRFILTK